METIIRDYGHAILTSIVGIFMCGAFMIAIYVLSI